MERVFSVNVIGHNGYSFAVRYKDYDGEISDSNVIDSAIESGFFEDDSDADICVVEEITNDEYTMKHFKDCTFDV